MIQLSTIDRLICHVDNALRTLTPTATTAERPSPATHVKDETTLSDDERQHAAGLMRINHTGEVCAQGLYQGQSLTARLPDIRDAMKHAAQEEVDHLVWCEERLTELNSRTSILNPIFYGLSYGIGAMAGAAGDKWSLGFVAATEDQVCKHLEEHLETLPAADQRSRAILKQMHIDEKEHATLALNAGGVAFPSIIKATMTQISKVMTKTTYRF